MAIAWTGPPWRSRRSPRNPLQTRDPLAEIRYLSGKLDEKFRRKQAEDRLRWAGRPALPAVEKAAQSTDAEVARRAARILPYVRWGLTRQLGELFGERLLAYPSVSLRARIKLVLEIKEVTGSESIGFLQSVLEGEDDASIWSLARDALRIRSRVNLVPFLEESAREGRAGGQIFRFLGREYSRRTLEGPRREAALTLAPMLIEQPRGFPDPHLYADWTGVLFDLGEVDRAVEIVAAGLAASGEGELGYRNIVARRLLSAGQAARAVKLLDPLLDDVKWGSKAVESLLAWRQTESAWQAAARLLENTLENPDLRARLAVLFFNHAQLEHAESLASPLGDDLPRRLSFLHRYTLDWEKGVALPQKGLIEEVEEYLWYGLGDEALALCQEHAGEGAGDDRFRRTALRAAVAAGDLDRAREFDDGAWYDQPADAAHARARFLLVLSEGDEERIQAEIEGAQEAFKHIGKMARTIGRDYLLRAIAGSGWRSPYQIDRFHVAEREGRPAEAYYELFKRLVGSRNRSRARQGLWDWAEARRKISYLSQADHILERAVAQADATRESAVVAEIFRQDGRWESALRAHEPYPWAEWDTLDHASTLIQAGHPARALSFLQRGGADNFSGKVRSRISRVLGILPSIESLPPVEILATSGTYFSARGMLTAARSEWQTLLALDFYLSHQGFDHLARAHFELALLRSLDQDFGGAADALLRSLQIGWVRHSSRKGRASSSSRNRAFDP